MVSIFDVPTNELIERAAKDLDSSGAVKAPAWAMFVKTGAHKERPPTRADWWQVRAAAILRKISIRGPVGVSKLRSQYGGKKNTGMSPEEVRKGSGSIIRKILQQLDKAGLTRHTKIGVHCGRVITPKGKSLLDKAATQVAKDLHIKITPIHTPKEAPAETAPVAVPSESAPAQTEQAPEKKAVKKK